MHGNKDGIKLGLLFGGDLPKMMLVKNLEDIIPLHKIKFTKY
jgi:hypothetical protein